MNRRDAERDAAGFSVGKVQQALLDGRFVEACPLLRCRRLRAPNANAGMTIQLVEMFESGLGQHLVDGEASLAAEGPFTPGNGGVAAHLAAMKAASPLRKVGAVRAGISRIPAGQTACGGLSPSSVRSATHWANHTIHSPCPVA